ncbi:beta-ketoacyl-ACP synthase III [Lactobacillus acetotolerans]|jgi:3-oxoacyl-[acyl-carrier-protein] synthase-3|uniref:Beta-ketoacyl-[acyl-carrier-protein] synthase III n=1 Tax=Lactobacillus acetotolerans TaxID=1600 RepID=A0A0D6A2U3_9LACO|nr:beta-ketoacyl-ACP synthase III [Lactobacillus acetotolerans]KRN41623.1 3-oxoacyl-ACP synthase 3 [Lactobacillus acetotolerans DSM 20749 = JCM 3825]QFG51067.1 ketoacyl-ACP synthase III [Lactobacillus acetotolerans]BAQ56999.1 3-oxoacyl-[acyl carrier protein] synthase [Lactobacillus acetotolerans]GGV11350.1 3-oxoacyl-[acyl-carrier-protein] synthase 3 [Lactobacillus acetotolerans DSM 20749 = JCM 3825]
MKYENVSILQTASSIPKKVVTNDDLAKMMDTSDEWISKRTGIKQRHVVTEQSTSDLCVDVSQKLLRQANLPAKRIDLIIVATMSPDYLTPSVSAMVQGKIGADNAAAFDINSACSGFAYGLKIAKQMLTADKSKYALLIGGETLSKLVNWQDRSTAVLFGDGAAGVLLTNAYSNSAGILADDLQTKGRLGHYLTAGYLANKSPFYQAAPTDSANKYFLMNGRQVYKFATENVPGSIRTALRKADLQTSDVDYFVLHQANSRIVERIARDLGVSIAKFPINIQEYGNTAAASEPILLDELVKKKIIRRGNIIVLSGFGGGLTIGTVVLKF